MLLLILSPSLALFADYLRQKFKAPNLLTNFVVAIITLPSLLIWLSGYTYKGTLGNCTGITLFITGTLLGMYSYGDIEPRNKTKLTKIFTVVMAFFLLLFYFSTIFSPRTDRIFNKRNYQNYEAVYSKDFDLVLDGPERIIIKKTNIFGLIEKTILNEKLPYSGTIPDCTLRVTDGKKKISFNYCENELTVKE